MEQNHMRTAMLRSDRLLSRFDPLERILCVDDFDDGFHGWQTYFPDYDGWDDYPQRYPHVEPLSEIIRMSKVDSGGMRVDRKLPIGPRGVPMLSTLTSWDVGTYGSYDGCYALKIPTLPKAGHKSIALKRMTCPWRGKYRVEAYFTYKSDPGNFRLGELDIRSLMLTFDVMDTHNPDIRKEESVRWWPGIRYHNAENGKLVQQWQADLHGSKGVLDGPWTDIKDGCQHLGYNRSPTKYQWHYLRFTFHLGRREYVDFNCYGQEFKVAGMKHEQDPPLTGFRASTDKCPGLVGTNFVVEADTDTRCYLYLDSVVISASEN